MPIGYLLLRAAEAGPARVLEVLAAERTLPLVGRSLALAALVTCAATVIGVGLAALVTRTTMPGRRAVGVLAGLPLAIPSYVAAYAWVSTWPALDGLAAAVLVLTACTYPYVYLPALAALRRVDAGTEHVARSLGHSGRRVFVGVTLRQIRPAVAGGAQLVALYALSDFGAVSIVRYDSFTRVIYTSYRAGFDRTPAAVLALVLVVVTLAVSVAEARSRSTSERMRADASPATPPQPVALGPLRYAALGACVVVLAAALGVPVGSLGYWFATELSAGVDWARLGASAAATAWFAALGGLACLALAVPVGVLAARHRGRLATVVELATWAGHALPGIVVALALVFAGTRVVPELYQRTPLLVVAYVVLFLPAAVASVRANVAMSPPALEEVARSLGRRPGAVVREVTLPLAAPGILAGLALVVLTAMKELPATLLLRPTGTDTLATGLWTQTSVAAYGAAAPYAVALVLLAVAPTLWLMRPHDRTAAGRVGSGAVRSVRAGAAVEGAAGVGATAASGGRRGAPDG